MSEDIRSHNIGASDYSKYKIQPWDIWLEYNLNPWDADIVKRVLRNKPGERRLDYEKIIHVCQERIRQIDVVYSSGIEITPGPTEPNEEVDIALLHLKQVLEDKEDD
jgi:hypothetical protein